MGGQPQAWRTPRTTRMPVRSLRSLMAELRHSHIDILKLDVEGAEWGVLEGWYGEGRELPVSQLVVEFHRFELDNRYNASPEVSYIISRLHLDGFDTVYHRNYIDL